MKSLMKQGRARMGGWAWDRDGGTRTQGMGGRGLGALLFLAATPPSSHLGGGRWGGGAINMSRISRRRQRGGTARGSERRQGQAGPTLVGGPWLLGRPRGSRRVPGLAAVLAEVAVALDVGTHQVAHLHGVDLAALAVADLGGGREGGAAAVRGDPVGGAGACPHSTPYLPCARLCAGCLCTRPW